MEKDEPNEVPRPSEAERLQVRFTPRCAPADASLGAVARRHTGGMGAAAAAAMASGALGSEGSAGPDMLQRGRSGDSMLPMPDVFGWSDQYGLSCHQAGDACMYQGRSVVSHGPPLRGRLISIAQRVSAAGRGRKRKERENQAAGEGDCGSGNDAPSFSARRWETSQSRMQWVLSDAA